jgi:hypothetical protein
MLRTPPQPRPRGLDELLPSGLIARVSQLDITSRKVFAGKLKGERRSKKRGDSVEFADHRPYTTGDDIRRLDWNLYARLDRLFLKLFLEEEDLSLHIVIDASVSMDCGDPSKLLFAQRAAAAIGYIGLVNYNRVTVTAIGATTGARVAAEEPENRPPDAGSEPAMISLRNLRGRRRAAELGSWLCGLEPAGAGAGGASFTECAKRIALTRQGKGVMLILSDFFYKEGYEQGMRYLVGRGYDVVAVQVLSPQEIEPTLGGDLRLRDVEDGDSAEVTISAPLLKRYKQNLAAYCEGLRLFCARREIALMSVPSDLKVDALLLDYLRSRGVVG